MSSRSSCSEICSRSRDLAHRRAATCAAGGDQHRRERHQPGEALGPDRGLLARAGRRLGRLGILGPRRHALGDARERLAAVALDDRVEPLARLGGELGRPGDAGVLAVAERPGDQEPRDRVVGAEHPAGVLGVDHLAVGPEVALDVPGDAVRHPDLRGAEACHRAARGSGSRTGAGRSRAGAGSRARPWWRRRPCRGCATAGTRARRCARANGPRGRTGAPGTAAGRGRPAGRRPRRTAS